MKLKQIIWITIGLLSMTFSANAQTETPALNKDGNLQESAIQNEMSRILMEDFNYAALLQRQDKLLGRRKSALIVTASGLGTTLAGAIVLQEVDSYAGGYIYLTGLLASGTGLIWLIVNEFNLIDNKKKINGMKLAAIPGGVALKF